MREAARSPSRAAPVGRQFCQFGFTLSEHATDVESEFGAGRDRLAGAERLPGPIGVIPAVDGHRLRRGIDESVVRDAGFAVVLPLDDAVAMFGFRTWAEHLDAQLGRIRNRIPHHPNG